MKRMLVAMIVLLPLSADAQPEAGVAFKGGINAATLDYQYRVNRYGASGGLAGYLQWLLSDRISMGGQLELLYTPRGAEVIRDGTLQGKIRQHYLDVVVAARPGLQLRPASVYLLLGAGVNFLVDAYDENRWGVPRDITHDVHRIDVALLAGAGVAFHLPHRRLGPVRLDTVFLEARHDRGMIDVSKMDFGFGNRTSSLMLGLSFGLGAGRRAPDAGN
jgi:hypothetical protein